MLSNKLDDFKDIQKEIKFLTNSDNRLEILKCLLKSPQTLKGIHEKTGLNNSSISINVSSLESKGYVTNRNDIFYLTNASKLILANIFYENDSGNVFDSLVKDGRISIILTDDDLEMFFTACDNFSSLFLFFDRMVFDDSEMLLIKDEENIKNSINMFNYFKDSFQTV